MIENTPKNIRRIDTNYAFVQSTYWIANCCVNGYLVIYLTYRGMNNTQCGLTSSLCAFLSVFIQLFLSDYMDRHIEIPMKRILILIMTISLAAAGCVKMLPLPITGLMLFYIVMHAANNSLNGFNNAQMMQYNNAGLDTHYGWPRGVGSIVFATASVIIGTLIERYDAGILSYIYLGAGVLYILMELLMPYPFKGYDLQGLKNTKGMETTTYKEMLLTNKPLVILLISILFMSMGQSGGFTFMIRIIENLGGGTKEYGISEFIRAGAELPALVFATFIYRKISTKTGIVLAMIFAGVKTWYMMLAPSLGLIYAGSAINFFVSGLYVYASVVFVNSITKPREKVRAQALTGLFYTFGSVGGNVCTGFMLDRLGLKVTFLISGCICIFAAMLLQFRCKTETGKMG